MIENGNRPEEIAMKRKKNEESITEKELNNKRMRIIDTSHAQQMNNYYNDLKARELDILSFFKQHCIICYMKSGKVVDSHLKRCPCIYNRCLRCFGFDHTVKDCKMKPITIPSTCSKCLLPTGGVLVYHNFGDDRNCFADILKDFIKCLMVFKQFPEIDKLFKTDSNGVLQLYTEFIEYFKEI